MGQRWKKKDTGQQIEITGKRGEDYASRKLNGSKMTHGLTKKDLLLFWEPME